MPNHGGQNSAGIEQELEVAGLGYVRSMHQGLVHADDRLPTFVFHCQSEP
jgi:hypothetical protein